MDIPQLIDELSRPTAYPFPVDHVETRQTHISVVFLAGDRVYKVKKPVDLGFLNFQSLESRKHFCAEEVRLNLRLAPKTYLGVVPITRGAEGVRFGGAGEPIDWAVEMRRLPESATLDKRLARGEATEPHLVTLAERLAAFHRDAESGPKISACGRFPIVAGNARENFTQTVTHIGTTVCAEVHERLRAATEHALAILEPLMESRANRHVPRDTHGDLHLDHIYLFPEKAAPDNLVIIDCIEFNERFRYADPIADIAFTAMDLKRHGRHDLSRQFAESYFAASKDDEGRALLRFYTAYRAIVRAKVDGFKSLEAEVASESRDRARQRSRHHWLLALGEMAPASDRPALVLTAGLPGVGKSTLAKHLADRHGFELLRSDVVRKRLAGISVDEPSPAHLRHELYSVEQTEQTYAECLRLADEALWRGRRVVVDANFPREELRRRFLDLADRWCVPAFLVHCRAALATVQRRLTTRRGDASDADWNIFQKAAREWEPLGPQTRAQTHEIETDGDLESLQTALTDWLRQALET